MDDEAQPANDAQPSESQPSLEEPTPNSVEETRKPPSVGRTEEPSADAPTPNVIEEEAQEEPLSVSRSQPRQEELLKSLSPYLSPSPAKGSPTGKSAHIATMKSLGLLHDLQVGALLGWVPLEAQLLTLADACLPACLPCMIMAELYTACISGLHQWGRDGCSGAEERAGEAERREEGYGEGEWEWGGIIDAGV